MTLTAEGNTSATVELLAEESGPLLEMAKLLVVDLSAQYSDPTALLQSHAMLVDIPGRQRMLTQRMSKDVFFLESGLNSEVAALELAKTAEIFETSLGALRGGMPEAGNVSPPNKAVEQGLGVVVRNWRAPKPFVNRALDGDALSDSERAEVFHGMNEMTSNMNKVVGLLSDASKRTGVMN